MKSSVSLSSNKPRLCKTVGDKTGRRGDKTSCGDRSGKTVTCKTVGTVGLRCVLRIACCTLRVAHCFLRVACCVLRVVRCVLRVVRRKRAGRQQICSTSRVRLVIKGDKRSDKKK